MVGILKLTARGLAKVRNRISARSFLTRSRANGAVPDAGIALFFATAPDNLYQFEQWRRPLEQLAEQRPVFVIVDRPDTGNLVLHTSSLPVAFARSSAELERLVGSRNVRVVLYCNQVESNFRMLRFGAPTHVQIGHGESDKGSSVSNQHKAYDLVFVAGDAGRQRLTQALRGFDGETRTLAIGRPQLDHSYAGAPDWPRDSGRRVWYAPTWEGDRPSIAYSSLVSHGMAIIQGLLADPGTRIIYRPHPRTGQASPAYTAADHRLRAVLRSYGERHLVDTGGYGWQWAFADACVTDISAVAYDWLATGKPLVITEPVEPLAFRPSSPLLDTLLLLDAGRASQIVSVLATLTEDATKITPSSAALSLGELARHYFGDTRDGASTRRFAAAIDAAANWPFREAI